MVFARVYCRLKQGDSAALEMSKANTGNRQKDALAWYAQQFREEGMDNESAGPSTLRHLFVLLIGLGMRESSGKYCEGRDRAVGNTSADSAEAGMFQTSFDATSANPLLGQLFEQYLSNQMVLLRPSRRESAAEPLTCRTLAPARVGNFNDSQRSAQPSLSNSPHSVYVSSERIGDRSTAEKRRSDPKAM